MVNESNTNKDKTINVYFCIEYSRYLFKYIHRLINRLKIMNLSWLIVCISYHRFNHLPKLVNGGLPTKFSRVIYSHDLMDTSCNYLNLSKANGKCVFEGKYQKIV